MQSYKAEFLSAKSVDALKCRISFGFWFRQLQELVSVETGEGHEKISNVWSPGTFFLHEGELELSAQPWKKWSMQITFSYSINFFLSGSLGCMVLTCTLPPGSQRKIILLSSRTCHLVASLSTRFVLVQTVPVLVTGGGMGGGGCQRNNYL